MISIVLTKDNEIIKIDKHDMQKSQHSNKWKLDTLYWKTWKNKINKITCA